MEEGTQFAPANSRPADEEQQTPPDQEEPKTLPKVGIRTMKADVEELFRTTKPSLLQMIGRGPDVPIMRTRHAESSGNKIVLVAAGIILLLLAIGAVGFFYVYFFPSSVVSPAHPPSLTLPPTFFKVEKTQIIIGSLKNRTALIQLIEDAVKSKEPEGFVKYIPIKLEEGILEHFATIDDFFSLWRMNPPHELLLVLEKPVMPYIYYSQDGPRFGFAVKVKDFDRAFRSLLTWESSLLTNFTPLFINEEPSVTVAPFENRTYRNIDWRFLKLSQTKDLGIGYALFPAGNIIFFVTGQEATETIISRLYATTR